MIGCAVTTGFFVLRRCGVTAVARCAQCQRPLCADHRADAGLCPECAAGRGFHGHPAAATAHGRRRFYHRTSAEYRDTSWYVALDDYDRSAFAPDAAGRDEYDTDGGSDFVDS